MAWLTNAGVVDEYGGVAVSALDLVCKLEEGVKVGDVALVEVDVWHYSNLSIGS